MQAKTRYNLKKANEISLIIDVDAYKAAYGDLKEAFGDNEDTYIEHYLTVDVYEGRTKGVLFDSIVYAEAYGDVKQAFGNNISAIVNHYVTFGAAENRTLGTSNGYSDIATAEKSGVSISRSSIVSSKISNGGGSSVTTSNDNSAAGSSAEVNQSYHHTTSIYEDNGKTTLLRVEYYDEDNNLTHYSDVTYTDNSTNSYTENIYHWDEEKGEEVLDRTDTYVNGELSSSENHG